MQPLDFYHGRPVVYSLGNLVFDGAPNLKNWNRGGAKGFSIRLIPVRLDARGFPHPDDEEIRAISLN